ncbi:hypothetical protein FNCP11_12140 [Fusobacterium nucleatum]|nr:hypothetical protein FNCP11_12140 [Fusobacterium nucleatum]BEP10293.1 hypothetical protein FNSP11_11370 [Fusobacterium nucleatum]
MYKALKIELKLTVAQKIKVCQTIGTEKDLYIMNILNIIKNNIN